MTDSSSDSSSSESLTWREHCLNCLLLLVWPLTAWYFSRRRAKRNTLWLPVEPTLEYADVDTDDLIRRGARGELTISTSSLGAPYVLPRWVLGLVARFSPAILPKIGVVFFFLPGCEISLYSLFLMQAHEWIPKSGFSPKFFLITGSMGITIVGFCWLLIAQMWLTVSLFRYTGTLWVARKRKYAGGLLADPADAPHFEGAETAEASMLCRDAVAAPAAVPVDRELSLHPKAKTTALKLILGMAIRGYGYDHAAKKSPKPREIADDLADLGMPIDEDTVRKWLADAKDSVLPVSTPP